MRSHRNSGRVLGLCAAAGLFALAPRVWGAGDPVAAPPLGKDPVEERILKVLEDLDRNQRRGMMNVPVEDGRLLRMLVEAGGAKRVVEFGTSNGYSGIWMSLALLKTGGRLITHELDKGRAEFARANFKRAGVEGVVTLVEGDGHLEAKRLEGPIDLVFIDADKEGYPDYLAKVLPLVRPGGLILAHNANMGGAGIAEYIRLVTTDPALETLFLPAPHRGMALTLKKR